MYQVIQKQIRPNTSVPFHEADTSQTISDECKKYFFENYILTGKNIDHTHVHSEDGLTCETITLWESEEVFNQFKSDPNVADFWLDRWRYCDEHNIIRSVSGIQT